MALIECYECGKAISKSAKTCPHCGAKNKKHTRAKSWIIILVFILFGILILSNIGNGPQKTPEKLSNSAAQIELLNGLINDGFLQIEAHYNKAYIDPKVWNSIDVNVKENLSRGLAIYCGNKKGTHLYWVDIYDKISGKKIAKYSNSWGFKVY